MQMNISDYNFNSGDRVVDKDNPDKDVMRVVSSDLKEAEKFELSDGTSVADNNPNYSSSDPVVEVVYESTIQSFFNKWNESESEDFKSDLKKFEEKWCVSFSRYYFPKSRLEYKA